MPMWWDEGDEWHCDGVLGYYWPSDNVSEGTSSALGDLGLWSHNDVSGWMSGADDIDGWGNLIFLDFSWP